MARGERESEGCVGLKVTVSFAALPHLLPLARTQMSHRTLPLLAVLFIAGSQLGAQSAGGPPTFQLTTSEYLKREGAEVMAFQDIYPEGHQGGVSIVQQGVRVASNGDLRLEATPGQWQPVPVQRRRLVDRAHNEILTSLAYPDTSKDRHGFNPILYPKLDLVYQVRVHGEGDAVRITVDLDKPLPAEWVGRVGFNLELYPTDLFGKSWYLGQAQGIFPRQPSGPNARDASGEVQPLPFASGHRLTIASEIPAQRLSIESFAGDLQLFDGRVKHNNGWFVVRSVVPTGATKGAVEWIVRPNAVPGWRDTPVVQVSQLGYHPAQRKVAVIELDARDAGAGSATLERIEESGGTRNVLTAAPSHFGNFLRYKYLRFDFSSVTKPGMYRVAYRDYRTEPFEIGDDVYAARAWQPTIDYFLPVQMCHMRVEEQYRVWHGIDHLDDARMARPDSNHFDGYHQGPSTLTRFNAGDIVPGLNAGGWHDAGDDDLRIESQADEVWILASMYEQFGLTYDNTTIDERARLVRIHQPDGKPDLLQQVTHGILSILGGYRSMGRLYRGIIVPTMPQYVLLGDITNSSDNLFYDASLPREGRTATTSGVPDDRLVFTEQNAGHEYKGIAALAIAGRVLRNTDPALARESSDAAEVLWHMSRDPNSGFDDRVAATVELLLTTYKREYSAALVAMQPQIVARIGSVGWMVGRALPAIQNAAFTAAVRQAVAANFAEMQAAQRRNPYGVPYQPVIWGAGWGIQRFGVEQYFLHGAFPDIVGTEYMLNALNFVLGTHPGRNTSSFASGVGARSMTTAYGFNRADWSYIPGGVVSGTALIRPDLPELKNFPFLWQQAEYVMGGGATHFMFLVLAADNLFAVRHISSTSSSSELHAASAAPDSNATLAATLRHALREETIGPWYPRAVDRDSGGFFSQFDYRWQPTGAQDKMIVTQARHVWTTARAAQFFPGDTMFLPASAHGFLFLRDKMWDAEQGGFFWLVTRGGTPKEDAPGRMIKQSYGNAFGIYALAGYYDVSHDARALRLAQDAFHWLDHHAHDPVYGGYFNYTERDGTPLRAGYHGDPPKDQNSSIHLLEAFTELYRVWPDSLLRARLVEMQALIRDTMRTDPGYLQLFFTENLTPVSYRDSSDSARASHHAIDHVSFGHDIETAYLLLEASEALGRQRDTTTERIAKQMVDHALRNGYDTSTGGFYDEGYYFKGKPNITITYPAKNWWAQAEGLNSLLIMADRYPADSLGYRARFLQQWAYINGNLIDHEHGGWYQGGLDKEPQQKTALKGHIWKAAYHDGRALMNVIRRLESAP
jgi:endoglucanase